MVGIPTFHLETSPPPSLAQPLLLWIGQNPGNDENREGRPFIGRAGRVLREMYIGASNLHAYPCLISNTARCFSRAKSGPTATQYSTCSKHWLWQDISTAAASCSQLYLIALGAPSAKAVLSLFGVLSSTLNEALAFNARALNHPEFPVAPRFFSTYHPASFLRNPNQLPVIASHLSLLHRALTDTLPIPSTPWIIPPRPPW